MPDHLHVIWHVRKPMPRGIMSVARGFWQAAKKLGRNYTSSFSPNTIRDKKLSSPLFTEMPFVRPLVRQGQLRTMFRYIDMNPQRLATKRMKPGFFRVQRDIVVGNRSYDGVGNTTLLMAETLATVHVRSKMVKAAENGDVEPLRNYKNSCVLAARKGTVMVSPFISTHEKQVMQVLLREKWPFICLTDNGFRDYYKPSDELFDACAAGRVLILSPWQHDASKRRISRAECVALNEMAEEIVNASAKG